MPEMVEIGLETIFGKNRFSALTTNWPTATISWDIIWLASLYTRQILNILIKRRDLPKLMELI